MTPEIIKEIAEQLDFDFQAFVHKTTEKLLFIPNEDLYYNDEDDPWSGDREELENNFSDYIKIEKWSSKEAFDVMAQFAEEVTHESFQQKLFDALNRKKPFREFKYVVENSEDYRESWFAFKNKWQQDYVTEQLKFCFK